MINKEVNTVMDILRIKNEINRLFDVNIENLRSRRRDPLFTDFSITGFNAARDIVNHVLDELQKEEEKDVKLNDSSPDPVDICDTDSWEYTYLVAFKRLGEGGGKTYRKINEKGEQR